jgi:hypothetical protein
MFGIEKGTGWMPTPACPHAVPPSLLRITVLPSPPPSIPCLPPPIYIYIYVCICIYRYIHIDSVALFLFLFLRALPEHVGFPSEHPLGVVHKYRPLPHQAQEG